MVASLILNRKMSVNPAQAAAFGNLSFIIYIGQSERLPGFPHLYPSLMTDRPTTTILEGRLEDPINTGFPADSGHVR